MAEAKHTAGHSFMLLDPLHEDGEDFETFAQVMNVACKRHMARTSQNPNSASMLLFEQTSKSKWESTDGGFVVVNCAALAKAGGA